MMAPAFDPNAVLRSFGFLAPDEAARLDERVQSKFYLVRIDGVGERWKCRRCNGTHAHFTSFCIEKPWRGIEHGLMAYWQNVGAGDPRTLSALQRERMRLAGKALGLNKNHPNLAKLHPEMARKLGGDDADTDVGAEILGILDEIPESKARVLAALINSRARSPIILL